jgi:hypothetical protein
MTLSIMAFSIMTLSIMAFSIITFTIEGLFVTLSINDNWHNNALNVVMLNIVMLNVVILNIVMVSVVVPLERLARDKRSSLFLPFVGDEERESFHQMNVTLLG